MPKYADVVHASPQDVWRVLHDLPLRVTWRRLYRESEWVKGRAGTPAAVARFKTRSREWHEVLLEVEAPHRARFEHRPASDGPGRGTREWRLQPVKPGTLLVLEVRGRNPLESWWLKHSQGWWHRRLVAGVKAAAESPPAAGAETSQPEPTPLAHKGKTRARGQGS